MKQLTLIRHAKSSWDELGLADIDRPLNGRGRRDAPEMGRRLGFSGFSPDLVLVSPALRTRQTAQALWAAMGTAPRCEIGPGLYMAGSRELLELIQASDASVVHLALIGHNPGLTALANRLGARSIDNIPTAGIVQFQIDSDRWSPLELNQVQWIDFDFPKKAPPK